METKKEIWAIFSRIYSIKSDAPKTQLQVELIDELAKYVENKKGENNVRKSKEPSKRK
jgi:hypothetical protein